MERWGKSEEQGYGKAVGLSGISGVEGVQGEESHFIQALLAS